MDNSNIKGLDLLNRVLDEAMEYFSQDVPTVIGVEATNHFKESFQNEGFTDTGLTKWAPRKSQRTGGTNSQKILSKTGELGDSPDWRVEGDTVIIYTDKKYAQIHNEGGRIQVTDKMRKYFWAQYYMAKEGGDSSLMSQYKAMALAKEIVIPKRQFMGESEVLNGKITDKIVRDLTNIFNQLL